MAGVTGPPCDSSDRRQNCRSRNLVYESSCMICNPVSSWQEVDGNQGGPRDGTYIGETSRSLHECAVEHMKDAEAYSAKSHIVNHWMMAHPDLNTPQKMAPKITSMFWDCLSRQIGDKLY